MLDADVISGLARSAVNYRSGIFCPAELWSQITGLLVGHDDADRLLAELPPELQEVLRGAYRDRPASLRSGQTAVEACRRVERWCRGAEA
jgi:hypothetical protein